MTTALFRRILFRVLCFLLICTTTGGAPVLRIGQNFTASTFGPDSTAVPPDTDGAVGPQHFVEFVNGRFAVFDKAGKLLSSTGDIAFWTNAGVTIGTSIDVTDPRVIYDPSSERWFASMVDVNRIARRQVANRFLLAVSATSDPTGSWHGLAFQASPGLNYFADFPTIGVDTNGVYLSGDLFDRFGNSVGPIVAALPKSSLLADPPKTNGMTSSGVLSYSSRGSILQPAITTGNASTPETILAVSDLGLDFGPHSTLVLSDMQDSAGKLTIGGRTVLSVPEYTTPINPVQPNGLDTLDDGDARFGSGVKRVGDILYAVHATEVDQRAAVRWYRIDVVHHTLLDSGTISDPVLELFFPSIAANEAGVVVIGCNGTSSEQYVSSYAVVGQTVDGQLSFGELTLLKAGASNYETQDETGIDRWGDYSATTVDPMDPNRFWTIQAYPKTTTAWATQVTEIIVGEEALTGPALAVSKAGSKLQITWADQPGLQLQFSPDLATRHWSSVAGTPAVSDGQATIELDLSGQTGFFRLAPQP